LLNLLAFVGGEQANFGQHLGMSQRSGDVLRIKAAIEAHKAGAAVWHVHAREKDGTPSKDPHVVKETIARVLDKCPDIVTSVVPYADYEHQGVDLLKRTVDVLTHAGPEYFQSAVLLIQTIGFSEKFTYIITEKTLSEQVKYLEDHGVRPEYQGTSYQGIKDVLDWLVDKGIAKDPPLMNIMMGYHGFCHGSPLNIEEFDYIFARDQAAQCLEIWDDLAPLTLIGHSHLCKSFALSQDGVHEVVSDRFELRPGWKYIVSVGSVTGFMAAPQQAAYGVMKAGLLSLARTVAAEYAGDGIRMNVAAAGAIATAAANANVATEVVEEIPAGRFGRSEEVAAAVVYLASDASSYMTGQQVVLDGGVSVRGPFD
jgi:NAD(P)-dependent dehydrogenase (short-subunit alcohol dehydrogenase family)